MSTQSSPSKASTNQPAFLFLQGPPSTFAKQVGRDLAKRGFKVKRINFCLGDWLYWRGKDCINFRGKAEEWPGFIEDLILSEGITDIIYFADRLPYHRAAASVARKLGVREISIEFGYLRPDWIIVERSGQSAYSNFPDKLSQIRKIAKAVTKPDFVHRYSFKFATEAFNEVVFNLSNWFGWFFYPHYDPDKYYNPLIEYLSYLRRFALLRLNKKAADQLQEQLVGSGAKYFIVPLQMQNDYQIRANSGDPLLSSVIEKTVKSFATNAETDAQLVFKVHPLDNGMENWKKLIKKLADQYSLTGRLHYMDGGDLLPLTRHAAGMVTVNSTSGLHALQQDTPVKVLGVSVYDMEGITHQGPLDEFWKSPFKPRPGDVKALVWALADTIHVKGDFYSRKGRAAASQAMIERLMVGNVNSHDAYISPPPRLEKARSLGIDVEYP